MTEFHKGDFVIYNAVTNNQVNPENKIGVVIELEENQCLISFINWEKGHDGGFGGGKSFWYCDKEYLTSLSKEKERSIKDVSIGDYVTQQGWTYTPKVVYLSTKGFVMQYRDLSEDYITFEEAENEGLYIEE